MNVGAVFHELPHEHKPGACIRIAVGVRANETSSKFDLQMDKCLHGQHKKKHRSQEDAYIVEF